MNDLPTLYREVCGCPDHGCDGPMPKGSIPTQTGWLEPVTEPLLSREEAANDPEVQKAVLVALGGEKVDTDWDDMYGGSRGLYVEVWLLADAPWSRRKVADDE